VISPARSFDAILFDRLRARRAPAPQGVRAALSEAASSG